MKLKNSFQEYDMALNLLLHLPRSLLHIGPISVDLHLYFLIYIYIYIYI